MKRDLLIIMTKYTLILAPLEVFAKRTFLGQGPETAALPDPEQMKNKIKASSNKLQAASCDKVVHVRMKKFLIEIAAADGFVY